MVLSFVFVSCSPNKAKDSSRRASAGLENAENYGSLAFADSSSAKTPESAPNNSPDLINYDEVVGVWISYIELSEILTGKTEEQFRQGYREMMDNCSSLGINTVFVHLRPFGDAVYKSEHYPWSKYVTGKLGREPAFDPLEVMLEETHQRGISFHGWLNPMRIQHNADIANVPKEYLIGQWYNDDHAKGRYIVEYGDNWYLNPAYNEVIELIGKGAEEITSRYNIDGIHIDDYFYPTTDNSFDADSYSESESTFASLSKFRRYNCNNMVRRLYSSAKLGNPDSLFGISPSGNLEYNERIYADVEAWCKNIGYTDYMAPQFYFGFDNSEQPYTECINNWQKMLKTSDVKLIFGLAVYKIGAEDIWAGEGSQEWVTQKQILLRQIQEAKKLDSYGGVVFYSYNYLFNPVHLSAAIQEEIEAFKPVIQGD